MISLRAKDWKSCHCHWIPQNHRVIMKTVKISTEVHKPRWSTTEMPRSSQTVLALFARALVNTYPFDIKKNAMEIFKAVAAFTWSLSGQSIDGRKNGNQAKMPRAPREKRRW